MNTKIELKSRLLHFKKLLKEKRAQLNLLTLSKLHNTLLCQ